MSRKRKIPQNHSESSDKNVPNESTKLLRNSTRLDRSFYDVSATTLAVNLLGKILVRKVNDETLKAIIVETEAYPGGDDKASHSYNNRRTERCEPMYMIPGTTYVYLTYGMYNCFNISASEPGGAVLLRALEPIEGMEAMKRARYKKKAIPDRFKLVDLCSGPAKLCLSMSISRDNNKMDLCDDESNTELWIEDGGVIVSDDVIVRAKRIGIGSTGDAAVNQLFRFYIRDNKNVSKK